MTLTTAMLLLAAVGILESFVVLWRMRTAVGHSKLASAAARFAATSTRLLFVWIGASAVMSSTPWWAALAAYALPATALDQIVLFLRNTATRELFWEDNIDNVGAFGSAITHAIHRHTLEPGQDPIFPDGWSCRCTPVHSNALKIITYPWQ